MSKVYLNGWAKWIAIGVTILTLVGGGVHQHTQAIGRLVAVEGRQHDYNESLDKVDADIEGLRVEVVAQGKLLARIAGRLGVPGHD